MVKFVKDNIESLSLCPLVPKPLHLHEGHVALDVAGGYWILLEATFGLLQD
jgi:hypothetical protein